jgi:hypothetical protein
MKILFWMRVTLDLINNFYVQVPKTMERVSFSKFTSFNAVENLEKNPWRLYRKHAKYHLGILVFSELLVIYKNSIFLGQKNVFFEAEKLDL